jgi:nudix-type nucleoside diphosphatase (YffH/AdpP family)
MSPAATTTPAITKVEVTHDRWTTMKVATVRLADGQVVERDVEDHGDAVAVLPYDPERRTAIVVRQFRAPPALVEAGLELLEAPAGRLDGDDPEAAARRETMEETGLRLGVLEPVVVAWTMPGVSTERAHLFLAPYGAADRVEAGGGLAEEHESITVLEMELHELARLADAGRLPELKLLVLLQALRLRRPELFAP